MKSIADYNDPFEAVEEFEKALGEFTGAPGVVAMDSCTHAIELGLRFRMPKLYSTIPAHTYISVPMTLKRLGIDYMHTELEWDKNYRIEGSMVYDCARHFEKDMFERDPGQAKIMCLSFGHGKPLEIGHGGAILTDSREAYEWIKKASYDGRNMKEHKHWGDQKEYDIGYHYHMRPEDAVIGLNKLESGDIQVIDNPGYKHYPDLREIKINN